MHICHFLSSVRPEVGGPARAVLDLCRALASRGHEVTLATCDLQGVPPEWQAPDGVGPRHVLLPPPRHARIAFAPNAAAQAAHLMQGQEVVHLHGVWEYVNVQLARTATRAGVPYVISVRGMLDDWCMSQRAPKKRLYLALCGRRWLEHARAIHLTAQAELEQAQRHFPRGRGVVIPNLLDLSPYRSMSGTEAARKAFPILENGRPNVLFLSRIHPKKRLENLLESLLILKQRNVEANLIIAGAGDEPYVAALEARARGLGLVDSEAAFLGQVTGDLKLALYQACDVFALPTSQENFGFVFAEALACGTPVVTTRGVDIWGELESGGGAVIADGDPQPFADALEGLLRDPERARTMGARGREWVFNWLDPEALLDQFEAMYEGREEATRASHS